MDQAVDPHVETDRRVAHGREQQRRTRVVRGAVPTVLVGILLCAAAVLMRNQIYVSDAKAEFHSSLAGLLEIFEQTDNLPLTYPPRGESGLPAPGSGFHYVDAGEIQALRNGEQEFLPLSSQVDETGSRRKA